MLNHSVFMGSIQRLCISILPFGSDERFALENKNQQKFRCVCGLMPNWTNLYWRHQTLASVTLNPSTRYSAVMYKGLQAGLQLNPHEAENCQVLNLSPMMPRNVIVSRTAIRQIGVVLSEVLFQSQWIFCAKTKYVIQFTLE